MANIDIADCLAAIVSAFQGGADAVQSLKDRRGKRRRMREQDWELAVEERILQQSLVHAAKQCKAISAERRQRYGDVFIRGDAQATSELKDVMMNLQADVVGVLQRGHAGDSAILDLLALQEAVITNKVLVLRATHSLCERIVASLPANQYTKNASMHSPRQANAFDGYNSWAAHADGARGSSESDGKTGAAMRSAESTPDEVAPMIPKRSPARRSSLFQMSETTPKRSLTRSLKARSSTWFPQIRRSDKADTAHQDIRAKGETQHPGTHCRERINRISLHDSAVGSSTAASKRQTSTSIASSVMDFDDLKRSSCVTADSFEEPEDFYKDCNVAQQTTSPTTRPETRSEQTKIAAPLTTNFAQGPACPRLPSPSPSSTKWDSPDDFIRIGFARQTTTAERPASVQHYRSRSDASLPSTSYPLQNIHPAFRNRHMDNVPATMAPKFNFRTSFSRPAKVEENRYV